MGESERISSMWRIGYIILPKSRGLLGKIMLPMNHPKQQNITSLCEPCKILGPSESSEAQLQ